MASDASTVLKRVDEENVEFIRFWFTDILGQLKSLRWAGTSCPTPSRTAWASTAP